MKSSLTETELWHSIITHDWNFDVVTRRLQDPRTHYSGRPLLFSAKQVKQRHFFDLSDTHLALKIDERVITIAPHQILSLVPSTHAQLQKNLTPDATSVVHQYLNTEFDTYRQLKDKKHFGFWAFYFDRTGQFEAAIQFPSLPTFKLALICSGSQLYQDKNYRQSWLEIRHCFNKAHILVAGASVAAAAAEALIRDGRLGFLTIGDPKQPNATNFNRTNYDVFDIAAAESKAIAFARRIHRQDPTQIIYLEPNGFRSESFACHLTGDNSCPPVNLMIEAIDNIKGKVKILELAASQNLPIIQLADIGSKVQLNFNSPNDYQSGKSVMFGVSQQKLRSLIESDFASAAAAFVGLDNAAFDEIGRFYRGKKNTPFGAVTPQLGSTALAAAALATEKALRYLLDQSVSPRFPHRRLIIDKKNNFFKTQNYRRPLAIILDYLFHLQSRLSPFS